MSGSPCRSLAVSLVFGLNHSLPWHFEATILLHRPILRERSQIAADLSPFTLSFRKWLAML